MIEHHFNLLPSVIQTWRPSNPLKWSDTETIYLWSPKLVRLCSYSKKRLPSLKPYENPSTSQQRYFGPEDEDSRFLRNTSIYRRVYTLPKPKRISSSSVRWLGYGQESRVRFPEGPGTFSLLQGPDRFWRLPSFLPNGHRGTKPTIHLCLEPKLRIPGALPPLPVMSWLVLQNMDYFFNYPWC